MAKAIHLVISSEARNPSRLPNKRFLPSVGMTDRGHFMMVSDADELCLAVLVLSEHQNASFDNRSTLSSVGEAEPRHTEPCPARRCFRHQAGLERFRLLNKSIEEQLGFGKDCFDAILKGGKNVGECFGGYFLTCMTAKNSAGCQQAQLKRSGAGNPMILCKFLPSVGMTGGDYNVPAVCSRLTIPDQAIQGAFHGQALFEQAV